MGHMERRPDIDTPSLLGRTALGPRTDGPRPSDDGPRHSDGRPSALGRTALPPCLYGKICMIFLIFSRNSQKNHPNHPKIAHVRMHGRSPDFRISRSSAKFPPPGLRCDSGITHPRPPLRLRPLRLAPFAPRPCSSLHSRRFASFAGSRRSVPGASPRSLGRGAPLPLSVRSLRLLPALSPAQLGLAACFRRSLRLSLVSPLVQPTPPALSAASPRAPSCVTCSAQGSPPPPVTPACEPIRYAASPFPCVIPPSCSVPPAQLASQRTEPSGAVRKSVVS